MTDKPTQPRRPDSGAVAPVGEEVRKRVTTGPAPAWATVRHADETFRKPDCRAIMLLDTQYYATSGECYHREVRRIENMPAGEQPEQWRIDFDPLTESVAVHSLAIIRDGKRIEQAKPGCYHFLRREEEPEHTAGDGITLMVRLGDARLNDIIDARYSVRSVPGVLAHRAWRMSSVPMDAAIRAYHFSVRFATGRPMRWTCGPENLPPVTHAIGGDTEWAWALENITPHGHEEGIPPWNLIHTWFQVSDCESWTEVANGFAAAWREEFTNPELIRVADGVKAGAATPLERAARAITFVQDEIRNLDTTAGSGGHIPRSPGAVIQRMAGDSMEKSFLLAHLLRMLGITAQTVLVNKEWRKSISRMLPAPDDFNHAVVHFEIDGQNRWVDPTIAWQGGGALEPPVPDYQAGLPVRPDASTLQPVLPLATPRDRYELDEVFLLDSRPGRNSTLQVNIKAFGGEADSLRREIAGRGVEELAGKHLGIYQQLFAGVMSGGELKYTDDRERNEFTLTEAYEIKDVLDVMRNPKVGIFRYQSHLIQSRLRYPGSGARRQPFALPYPCSIEHSIEMRFTAPTGRFLPNENHKSGHLEYSREGRRGSNRAFVKYGLRMLADTVLAGEFDAHKQLVNEIWPGTSFFFQFSRAVPAQRSRLMTEAEVLPEAASPQAQPSPPGPSAASPSPGMTSIRQRAWEKKLSVLEREAAGTAPARPKIVSPVHPRSPRRGKPEPLPTKEPGDTVKAKRVIIITIVVALIFWIVLAMVMYKG